MLRRLMERGLVQVSSPDDPDAVQKTLGTGIEAVVTDGILRVRETGTPAPCRQGRRRWLTSSFASTTCASGIAVLVTIPERVGGRAVKRNILIDFGNALGTEGGSDEVFGPVHRRHDGQARREAARSVRHDP